MPLAEAKAVVEDILSEFCFYEPELDKSRAIAFLLTPMLRLLIGESRAQVFYASGNRPGTGKDYLLGLGELIYAGNLPVYYPPTSNEEELRKQLLSMCLAGERFYIQSNVKGHFQSPAYEAACASPYYSDRILGKSENKTLPNAAVYAISGNSLTLSEDMERSVLDIVPVQTKAVGKFGYIHSGA